MMLPFILLFVGLLLIFFEFFLPGGVLGTIGGVTVLASVILFIMQNDSPLYIALYIVGTILLLAFLIRFALWKIRTSKSKESIYSNQDQEGFIASSYDKTAIGKKAIVDTDLRPGGHILLEGKRLLAISQSGYIVKGQTVVVVGGEGESLIVVSVQEKDNKETRIKE